MIEPAALLQRLGVPVLDHHEPSAWLRAQLGSILNAREVWLCRHVQPGNVPAILLAVSDHPGLIGCPDCMARQPVSDEQRCARCGQPAHGACIADLHDTPVDGTHLLVLFRLCADCATRESEKLTGWSEGQ